MDLIELTELILEKHSLDPNFQIKKAIRGLNGFNNFDLVYALISTSNQEDAARTLGYTPDPIKRACRQVLLPLYSSRSHAFDDPRGNPSWRYALLHSIQYKYCTLCDTILNHSEFTKNKSSTGGLCSYCRVCSVLMSKRYKYNISIRTPKWANLVEIREVYKNCPEGMHVDHVIPLNGKFVSGLHIHTNLQYLHEQDNISKGNRIDLDEYNRNVT